MQIDDIVSGDFTAALKGKTSPSLVLDYCSSGSLSIDVSAVIHLASPLAGRETPEAGLNVCPQGMAHESKLTERQSALEGTLNILRQSVKAGVHKVVLTSSWATTLDRVLLSMRSSIESTQHPPSSQHRWLPHLRELRSLRRVRLAATTLPLHRTFVDISSLQTGGTPLARTCSP